MNESVIVMNVRGFGGLEIGDSIIVRRRRRFWYKPWTWFKKNWVPIGTIESLMSGGTTITIRKENP